MWLFLLATAAVANVFTDKDRSPEEAYHIDWNVGVHEAEDVKIAAVVAHIGELGVYVIHAPVMFLLLLLHWYLSATSIVCMVLYQN